jgi:hypothetical protein
LLREINLLDFNNDYNNNIPKLILFNAGCNIKFHNIIRKEIYNCLKENNDIKNNKENMNNMNKIEDIKLDNKFIDHKYLTPFALKYNICFDIVLDDKIQKEEIINEKSNQKIYLFLRNKMDDENIKIYHTFVNYKLKEKDFIELHHKIKILLSQNIKNN